MRDIGCQGGSSIINDPAELRRLDCNVSMSFIAGLQNSIRDAEHVKNTEMLVYLLHMALEEARLVSEGHSLKTLPVSSHTDALARL